MTSEIKNIWEDNQILRQIIGRCHVGETCAEVLEYVKTRMRFEALDEQNQLWVEAAVVAIHEENRALYNRVMRGF